MTKFLATRRKHRERLTYGKVTRQERYIITLSHKIVPYSEQNYTSFFTYFVLVVNKVKLISNEIRHYFLLKFNNYYAHINIFKGGEYLYSTAKIIVIFRFTWSTLQRLPAAMMISKPNLKKLLQA